MQTQHKALWMASLSNGETIHEEKGNYKRTPGEPSPWVRLLSYIAANNLTITSLAIYTECGRRFNLPSLGHNPRFRAFSEAQKPVEFNFERNLGQDVIGDTKSGAPDLYAVISARYEDGSTLQMWVDDKSLSVWTLIL